MQHTILYERYLNLLEKERFLNEILRTWQPVLLLFSIFLFCTFIYTGITIIKLWLENSFLKERINIVLEILIKKQICICEGEQLNSCDKKNIKECWKRIIFDRKKKLSYKSRIKE